MSPTIPFLDLGAENAPDFAEIRQAAARVIDSGRYIGGSENEAFEHRLAACTGVDYAIGCANGLDALRLVFRALIELGRLKPGQGVVVPANTYIATWLAVSDCGLRLVPVDPDPATMNITGADVAKVLDTTTEHVAAILTVHLYGRPAFDAEMLDLARQRGLIIVEDNAQAIGAQAAIEGLSGRSRRTGALGHAAAFSFYPTKNIGAMGDAGAVTTDDAELAAAVRALGNYGSDRRYHNIYKGLNSRLDPMQAAILDVKLRRLEQVSHRRRQLADIYNRHIANPLLKLPPSDTLDGVQSVWHQYALRVQAPGVDETAEELLRNEFRTHMLDLGVQTDVNYPLSPHRQPCYAEMAQMSFPEAERIARTVVSLPLNTSLTDAQAEYIALTANEFSI